MSDPIRLSRRLIELTGCSRREADLYIEGGWVTVDGQVVEEPQFKVDTQKVELLDGATANAPDPVTLIINQPAGTTAEAALKSMTAQTTWLEQATGKRMLKGHFLRQQNALPLQEHASGLAVFSQDWRVLRKLNDTQRPLEQEYVVQVSGRMIDDGLARMSRGLLLQGRQWPAVKASWQSENRLRLVVKNPSPGLLASLCAAVGLQVIAMRRIRIGALAMGKLPDGQWRYLSGREKF